MYDTNTFLRSELDYRTDRIKTGLARQGKRPSRIRRVRRARVDGTVR